MGVGFANRYLFGCPSFTDAESTAKGWAEEVEKTLNA